MSNQRKDVSNVPVIVEGVTGMQATLFADSDRSDWASAAQSAPAQTPLELPRATDQRDRRCRQFLCGVEPTDQSAPDYARRRSDEYERRQK
jgi:hypothetical protein